MTSSINVETQNRLEKTALYVFGLAVLITVCILIMGVMIHRKAIDPEALTNFKYMRELNIGDIWTGETFPGHFVTYRPLMATLLRMEYLVFGFSPPAYFTINLVMLILVAFLLYDIIFRKTGEMLPALLGTLFFITDWQIVQAIYVIGEVQITLAGFFGLSALWLFWFRKDSKILKPTAIFILLLAAAFSKEFGMAFAFAIFIYSIYKRAGNWKTYAALSVGSVLTFFVIRFLAVPEMPMGREYPSFLNMLKWLFLNTTSGFVFTFLNLFRPASDGDLPKIETLHFPATESWLVLIFQIIPIILLFILGIRNKDYRKITLPFLFLLIGNSFLFFFNYAFRFHFLGKIAMYAIVGFGIHSLYKKSLQVPKRISTLIIAFMAITVILLWRGDSFHKYLETHRSWTENNVLCIPTDEYYQQEDFYGYFTSTDQETVRLVVDYYGFPIEYCDCLDPHGYCK